MQDLRDKVLHANKIYFICSGNIIRSSFAELLARHHGISNVGSYGTTYFNSSIHQRSKTELQKLGIAKTLLDNFSPTHISEMQEFDPTDLHLVMTSKHMQDLLSEGVDGSQIMKITEVLGRSDDIADPYFEGNWEIAYSTIHEAVLQLTKILTGDL